MKNSRLLMSILLAPALMACDNSTLPPVGPAVGSYTAVSFVTTGASGQRNEITAGSTLVLNLNANGTTSGHLHVAANGSDPAFDSDLPGTWTQTGTTVNLTMPTVDTFVEDMPFEMTPGLFGGWELVGDRGFSGTRIQLTLKQT